MHQRVGLIRKKMCRRRNVLVVFCATFVLYMTSYVYREMSGYHLLHSNTIVFEQNKDSTLNTGRWILKVASYNIWSNYLVKVGSDIEQRLDGLAFGVQHYDVVILQEIFVLRLGPFVFFNYAKHLVSAMKKHQFIYRVSLQETVPWIFGQSNGLAIFSKFPISLAKSIHFKDSAILERVNNKGFVYAEIKINKQKVFVLNTHTDAHKKSIRELQMKQLADFIKTFPKTAYIIAGGDFNVNPNNPPADGNEEEYQNLVKTMLDAGLQQVFTERNATHLNGGNYDHMFVSSNCDILKREVINLHTKDGKMVSDHYGLSAGLKLLESV